MGQVDSGLAAVNQELQAERANALGRLGRAVERAIAEAKAVELALPPEGEARERALALHEVLRKEAETQLWYLIVTREACGLRRHQDVYEAYPLPARLSGG